MGIKNLSGIRVLDMTRYLPGGYTTQAFADLKAEVIKVEEVGKGDFCRGDKPKINGVSYYFAALNRNKKSLALNLKNDDGKEIFRRLAKQSDVIVENYRPGVTKRLGIDYSEIKRINPKIIYCSISAYGQDNPKSLKANHDINLLAQTGYLSLNGGQLTPLHLSDLATAMVAVQGIYLALFQREVNGEGQHVDVSMFDSFLWWLSLSYSRYHFQGSSLSANTWEYPAFCYNLYKTKDDGLLAFGMVERKFWEEFCVKNDMKEFIPKQFLRPHEDEEGWEKMCSFVASKTLREWSDWLEDKDICITLVKDVKDAVQSIMAEGSDMLAYNDYPIVGKILQTGLPIKLSEMPVSLKDAESPPVLGIDNKEILTKMGYGEKEIDDFIVKGAIG